MVNCSKFFSQEGDRQRVTCTDTQDLAPHEFWLFPNLILERKICSYWRYFLKCGSKPVSICSTSSSHKYLQNALYIQSLLLKMETAFLKTISLFVSYGENPTYINFMKPFSSMEKRGNTVVTKDFDFWYEFWYLNQSEILALHIFPQASSRQSNS